ncbi:MAG: hypothetical protein WD336_09685, partial [Trueperaceae bacterium]
MLGSWTRNTLALVVALTAALTVACATAAAATVVGDISTLAGNGTGAYGGDGTPAAAAQLHMPNGVAAAGEDFYLGEGFLVADNYNNRVRFVDSGGDIDTVAGGGTGGLGDGGPATDATLAGPVAVVPTASDFFLGEGFLIGEFYGHRVRFVDSGGDIDTVAGTGTSGYGGDHGQATTAQLGFPSGAAATGDDFFLGEGFLIADFGNDRVRFVDSDGVITTAAGTGTGGFGGDNGLAVDAALKRPAAVATSEHGFLVADSANNRVREVSAADRKIRTVAGGGGAGLGDGGPATSAELLLPQGVAAAANGGFLVADTANQRVRHVDCAGAIATVAGKGPALFGGYNGDNILATAAQLNFPIGVSPTSAGSSLGEGFLIGDSFNNRVRFAELDLPGPGTPGVTVTETGGSTNVAEGGASDTYQVVLNSRPTGDVHVALDPDGQVETSPAGLTFDDCNWNVPQQVTVSAVDDQVDEPSPHAGVVSHSASSADPGYDGISVADVSADVTDDDSAGVTITESGGSTEVSEDGSADDTYDVVLQSEPTEAVTITLTPDPQVNVSQPSLTFQPGDWNTPQQITVSAVDDQVDEPSPH